MFSFLKSKSFWAKALAWIAGAASALAANGMLGHYSGVIATVGPLLSAAAVHGAASTDGSK